MLVIYLYLHVWRTKDPFCKHPLLVPYATLIGCRSPVNWQWLCGVLFGVCSACVSGRGFKRIGGRSESICRPVAPSPHPFPSVSTDWRLQRSGPSSHAATAPPDTQQTQQKQTWGLNNAQTYSPWSASHSCLHPSHHPVLLPSADWLTLLWTLLTTSQTDSCPFFVWKESRAKLQAIHQSPIDCGLVLWQAYSAREHLQCCVQDSILLFCCIVSVYLVKYPIRPHLRLSLLQKRMIKIFI